jgi:single-stranded DNA-specific DHH superfamily exonuclease
VARSDFSFRLPCQRWQIAPPQPEQAAQLAQATQLSPLLTQVLINRHIHTPEAARTFLDPELQLLPSPLVEFPDLPIALELLLRAISLRQFIAICGDYDADGMTSTALLLRALRFLGGIVDYAIPSRMQEGYGINSRIVQDFHQEGVGLILTVDNGIAAHEPIALARELGMAVIVTDHHDLPPSLPVANAILNPKLLQNDSPYRGIAGVGVAYILAVCLAQSLQKTQDLTTPLIELFTLGTIADLAPLTGVNRRWVKRGLKLLPKSRIAGVQALIQVAGLSNERTLKPEAIGFRLGPRINAIGRLSDPQIVIELLTTDDEGRALELAMKCEQVNQLRQRLCELIEQDAIAWCQQTQFDPQQSRVLVIVQPGWHHGVIGIVASRLVERYGVPVFIGTYEDEAAVDPVSDCGETGQPSGTTSPTEETVEPPPATKIRGSARGIPEFNVFEALQACGDLLDKFGGHRAAGGFTFAAAHLDAFRSRLQQFAHHVLRPEHLKPLVTIDAQADFRSLTLELYNQIDWLHPCGIENPDPVFWTADVRVVEQQTVGRGQTHLKLTLAQESDPSTAIRAIAWRWGEYYPLPNRLDVAYRLRLNEWNGTQSVELELVGVRAAMTAADSEPQPPYPPAPPAPPFPPLADASPSSQDITSIPPGLLNRPESAQSSAQSKSTDIEATLNANADASCFEKARHSPVTPPTQIEFYYNKRRYAGDVYQNGAGKELRIHNLEGQLLIIQPEQRRGLLGYCREDAREIDVSHPYYFNLIRSALCAWELAEKDQIIQQKNQLIAAKEKQIARLLHHIEELEQRLEHYALGHALGHSQSGKPLLTLLTAVDDSDEVSLNKCVNEAVDEPAATVGIDRATDASAEAAMLVNPAPTIDEDSGAESVSSTQTQGIKSTAPLCDVGSLATILDQLVDPKQQLPDLLGDAVWRKLDRRSQKDLIAAYQTLAALQTAPTAEEERDYSDVALRLCSVIEREVVQPFFKRLHQFLQATDGSSEIGGVTLRARKKYTLGMVPPLLAEHWHSVQDDAWAAGVADAAEHYVTSASAVDPTERQLVQTCLQQWQTPLAIWLQTPTAASAIARIDRLLTIAADADTIFRQGHFALLHALVMGNETMAGLLQAIV